MPSYEYEIGTSLATMVNVEELAPVLTDETCVPPRGLAVEPYSVKRVAANGLEVGDGFPTTVWEFDIMYQQQFDEFILLLNGAQSAELYIHTRCDDRNYKYYKAIMHRPKVPDEAEPMMYNFWTNIKFRFTMLEEVGVY